MKKKCGFKRVCAMNELLYTKTYAKKLGLEKSSWWGGMALLLVCLVHYIYQKSDELLTVKTYKLVCK